MKKRTSLMIVSMISMMIALIAGLCAFTASGSGFLDLSNWVRSAAIGAAVICGGLSILTAVIARKKK